MSRFDAIDRARSLCADVEFDLDHLKPSVLARMRLLDEHSETISDAERMAANAHVVFRYYEEHEPSAAFTEAERRIVILGCLFSDIGKTGPLRANDSQQRLIVDMFAIEGVRDEKQSVSRFFENHFPNDAAERIRRFTELGLDPNMTLREFWNHHSAWTLEIAEAGGVPDEAVAAAAVHHLLEHVNPGQIVDEKRRFTRAFGDNLSFDRPEKLVILLDKYDAARRRGRLDHARAIEWLRDRLDKNTEFRGDPELVALIAVLERAFAESSASAT